MITWIERLRMEKYYVNWRQGRKHQDHEIYTGSLFERVLIQEDRTYIAEIDGELLGKCIRAITIGPQLLKYASQQPYDIAKMVQEADGKSVAQDRSRSRSPADFGMDVPKPLIRHYQEGLQRLARDKWQVNKPGGEVWVLGPKRDLYLVWPRCGNDLFALLRDEDVASPADPHLIADIIGDFNFLRETPNGDYYWEIKPADLNDDTLVALCVEPEWAPTIIKVLPTGLDGLVRPNDGRSPWRNVGESVASGTPSNIIPLRSLGDQSDSPEREDQAASSDEVTTAGPAGEVNNPAEFFSQAGLGGEVLLRVAQDIAAGTKVAGSDYLFDAQVSLAWGDSNKIIKDYAEYTPSEVLRKLSDLGWVAYDALSVAKVQDVAGLGRAIVLNTEISERFKVLVEELRNSVSFSLPTAQEKLSKNEVLESTDPESDEESSWKNALNDLIQKRGWVDYEVAVILIRSKSGCSPEIADFLLRMDYDVQGKPDNIKVYPL
ncbi:MAG: hypothetical protein DRH04_10445 [Deltaproteobacteria bacterium]|nr:MAG: hypothetical protein DRH04_10445 [Deltaproteobacteria bacterium]